MYRSFTVSIWNLGPKKEGSGRRKRGRIRWLFSRDKWTSKSLTDVALDNSGVCIFSPSLDIRNETRSKTSLYFYFDDFWHLVFDNCEKGVSDHYPEVLRSVYNVRSNRCRFSHKCPIVNRHQRGQFLVLIGLIGDYSGLRTGLFRPSPTGSTLSVGGCHQISWSMSPPLNKVIVKLICVVI